jgi:uncharacterized protein YbjT (DUF2867 family)
MNTKIAAVIGATGLIGEQITNALLNDINYVEVRILVRKKPLIENTKLKCLVIDFTDELEIKKALMNCDTIFMAIGTTQKKVKGNKQEYLKVDYDIPIRFARIGFELGCKQYLLVSALGANYKSNNFYLQLKGSVEEEIKKIGFEQFHIFRPSLLLGKRKEVRFGEVLSKLLMVPFNFILPNKLKAIESISVANSMVSYSKKTLTGVHVHYHSDMINHLD